ncbi:MAG: ASKHA domain-containing protein [Deltaproteobacteria bacterium]|jgi:uncharacterized 2Fe-2S/4Fe-4S cluster protein (DUF4445 family)|nr:ASKHA domain-containing protein [Deltaproteobacteria bacterium]
MILTVCRPGHEDMAIEASDRATIMEALALGGLHLDAPCGGRGRCGKCLVKASGRLEPPGEREAGLLEGHEGYRLACLARCAGDASVGLAAESLFKAVKGLGWSAPYSLDPPIRLLAVPERGRQDQRSLSELMGLEAGRRQALESIGALEADRAAAHVLACHGEILAAFPAGQEAPATLAAALDLGTTGLSVAVLDLAGREIVAMGTALNPQTAIGADVISRITSAAQSAEDLRVLQDLVLDGLRDLLVSAVGQPTARTISGAVISGNTTMLHLLAGVNPKSLAQAPYRPIFTGALDVSWLAPRLGLAGHAMVTTTPSISAFVGGDITSGMLAIKLAERPGTRMFIDIGTNGEIVLSRGGRLVATSCAAGPALEGMNIACGTRAVTGAVDGFRLGPGLAPAFTTIGQAPAIGLCGSGLIDVCAELVKAGLISRTGKMAQGPGSPPELRDGRYHLTDSVFLGQKDIRQVQLAKGAIAAAMRMLLERLGLSMADLDEVIVAGSFGFHLRDESLSDIGLIPGGYRGPVTFVGNSSLAGAARLLLDRTAREEIGRLSGQVEVIELAFDPRFQETFLAELGF